MAVSLALIASVLLALFAKIRLRKRAIEAALPPLGKFVSVSGAKVHYLQSGAGPDIVLIHGASGNLREWEFGLRAELEKTYRVTAFDRPGHGYSDPIRQGTHLAAQAAHLRSAVQALGIRTDVLIGHSYGGAVALAWALQQPPRAMVLLAAPSLPWPGKLDIWYRVTKLAPLQWVLAALAAAFVPAAYVRRATDAVFAPQSPPAQYHARFGAMLATRARNLAINAASVNALRGDLVAQMAAYKALQIPIALLHGTDDTIVPLDIHSAPLAKILPNATLTVLQGVGHMPHHAVQDAVVTAVQDAVVTAVQDAVVTAVQMGAANPLP